MTLIKRYYHGDHIDKIVIIPDLSCCQEYHTTAEVDFADQALLKNSPIMYNHLINLKGNGNRV